MKPRKTSYDVAFSMGAACSCTQGLRDAGLQYLSFPFDWLYGADLPARTDLLCAEFEGLLDLEDLEYVQKNPFNDKDLYRNVRNQLVFNHDFPSGVPVADSIGAVKEKYKRRGDRLLSLIRKANRILLVWISTPAMPKAPAGQWRRTVDRCAEALQRKFGRGKTFDFCILEHDAAIPFDERAFVPLGEHALYTTFAYKDNRPGAQPYSVIAKDVAAVLGELFAVGDYRTEVELHRYEEILKTRRSEARVRKFGADRGIRMFWGKLAYKIRKHFKKYHR